MAAQRGAEKAENAKITFSDNPWPGIAAVFGLALTVRRDGEHGAADDACGQSGLASARRP